MKKNKFKDFFRAAILAKIPTLVKSKKYHHLCWFWYLSI